MVPTNGTHPLRSQQPAQASATLPLARTLMSPWQHPASWLCATACSSWNAIHFCTAARQAANARVCSVQQQAFSCCVQLLERCPSVQQCASGHGWRAASGAHAGAPVLQTTYGVEQVAMHAGGPVLMARPRHCSTRLPKRCSNRRAHALGQPLRHARCLQLHRARAGGPRGGPRLTSVRGTVEEP